MTPSNDKPLDLSALVDVLENKAGFAPVTEVELDFRARVTKRGGRLVLEVSETGQTFQVSKKTKGQAPSEGQLIEGRAVLENVRSGNRLKLLEWKPAQATEAQR